MTTNIDESEEWREAGEILVEAMRSEMQRGSIGVQSYIDKIHPLWKRYEKMERTEELLEEIRKLKNQ